MTQEPHQPAAPARVWVTPAFQAEDLEAAELRSGPRDVNPPGFPPFGDCTMC